MGHTDEPVGCNLERRFGGMDRRRRVRRMRQLDLSNEFIDRIIESGGNMPDGNDLQVSTNDIDRILNVSVNGKSLWSQLEEDRMVYPEKLLSMGFSQDDILIAAKMQKIGILNELLAKEGKREIFWGMLLGVAIALFAIWLIA